MASCYLRCSCEEVAVSPLAGYRAPCESNLSSGEARSGLAHAATLAGNDPGEIRTRAEAQSPAGQLKMGGPNADA